MNNARRDAEWLAYNRHSSAPYDAINPEHYKGERQFEPIDVIEDWGLNYHLGNALKYIARNGRKPGEDPRQGLSKAIWYLERLQDELTEEAAQKADADDLIESIERQREVEFNALGEIPRSITFGSDEDVIPFDAEGWEYPDFDLNYGAAEPTHATQIQYDWRDGDNMLRHQSNGDVIFLGRHPDAPPLNYDEVVKSIIEDEKPDPWDQIPSDVNLDEVPPPIRDRFIFEFDR